MAVSPIWTVHLDPSVSTVARCGWSNMMRMKTASALRVRSTVRMVWVASPGSALKSIADLVSNTIHSVSARWKIAAAVDAANENAMRRLAPSRASSAATLSLPGFGPAVCTGAAAIDGAAPPVAACGDAADGNAEAGDGFAG